jgi:hypothetical protein
VSGTASVKPPKNDAEWARNTERRLQQAEHPLSMRAGNWVFSTNPDTGDLIASNVNGGSVIIATEPLPSDDANPDIISAQAYQVTVTRTALQSIPSGGTTVIWDGVLTEIGDGWGTGPGATTITAPVSGVYRLSSMLHWETGGVSCTTAILVDNSTVLIGRFPDTTGGGWVSSIAAGDVHVSAGSEISVYALPATATRNIGASQLSNPAVPCSLSASLITSPAGG